jgi:septum formation protein
VSRSRLLLASTSPRRKELLGLLGIPFEVVNPHYVEHATAEKPLVQALHHAEGKAAAVSKGHPDVLVLASDTLIELDGAGLGKPGSIDDARVMLNRLIGRDHVVHTAVAVRRACDGVSQNGIESVQVRMRPVSDEDLEQYLQSGEWLDKAGAYAIQGSGSALIAKIEGDYTAVVGLPLRLVARLLMPHMTLPVDPEGLYRARPYGNWSCYSSSEGLPP